MEKLETEEEIEILVNLVCYLLEENIDTKTPEKKKEENREIMKCAAERLKELR